ncbi:hypothetical protein, partial [Streptomyces sp. NPDC000851]
MHERHPNKALDGRGTQSDPIPRFLSSRRRHIFVSTSDICTRIPFGLSSELDQPPARTVSTQNGAMNR